MYGTWINTGDFYVWSSGLIRKFEVDSRLNPTPAAGCRTHSDVCVSAVNNTSTLNTWNCQASVFHCEGYPPPPPPPLTCQVTHLFFSTWWTPEISWQHVWKLPSGSIDCSISGTVVNPQWVFKYDGCGLIYGVKGHRLQTTVGWRLSSDKIIIE